MIQVSAELVARLPHAPKIDPSRSAGLERPQTASLCCNGLAELPADSLQARVLAALATVLARWCGVDRVELAIPGSGSCRLELDAQATTRALLEAAQKPLVRGAEAVAQPASRPSMSLDCTTGSGKVSLICETHGLARWVADAILGHVARVLEQLGDERPVRVRDLELGAATRAVGYEPVLAVAACGNAAGAFLDIAKRDPTRLAIVDGSSRVTYAQLAERVLKLTAALQQHGVQTGNVVALYLERSSDAVAAQLAVLCAGGVWLVLDPESPASRREQLLREAAPRVILSGAHGALEPSANTPCLVLGELLKQERRALGPVPLDVSAPAYIIFTSGTTGVAKGVVLCHGGLLNMAYAHSQVLRMHSRSRVLQAFSMAFDAAVFEVFAPLLTGASLAIVAKGVLLDAAELARFIREKDVTSIQLPPAVLATLNPLELPGVETVLVGGEVYPQELVHRWAATHRVLNFYGPSETTVSATCFEQDGRSPAPVIGRPLPNVRAYVLDDCQRETAVGVSGELWIGGSGVGVGYLNQPTQTAERFLPDPFATEPGARMYRTGDRARVLSDGTLQFLGRRDLQVKVRGHRVELEEVEAAVLRAGGVKEAAACVAPGSTSEDLICYVVASDPATRSGELRAQLLRQLPTYLVPSRFVIVDRLPRLASGKLDRPGLTALGASESAESRASESAEPSASESAEPEPSAPNAAHTPTTRALSAIWSALLGTDGLPLGASLVECGGHSLTAMRIIALVRERFGVALPLAELLGPEGSISALARRIDEAQAPTVEAVQPDAADPHRPRSAVEALWLHQLTRAASVTYNEPLAAHLKGPLDVQALEMAWRALVARHPALRTRVNARAQELRGELVSGTAFQLSRVDLSSERIDTRKARALELCDQQLRTPFALEHELPLRVVLYELSPSDHVLLVVLHHSAVDGWSYGVIARDLAHAYSAAKSGTPPQAAAVTASISPRPDRPSAADLAFWRARLEGATEACRLPLDRPRGAVLTEQGDRVSLQFSSVEASALRQLAAAQGWSLFSVLAAVFATALLRHGDEDELVLGTIVADRADSGSQSLVGYLADALPLRIKAHDNPTFAELIARVRGCVLEALEHRSVPFSVLVRELNPVRTASLSPFFQSLIVLQEPQPGLELEGVEVTALPLHNGCAKFDLSWEAQLEVDGRLTGHLEFRTALFDAHSMEKLAERVRWIANQCVRQPWLRLREIQLLPPAERAATLARSLPRALHAADISLWELFAQQAERAPAAVALRNAEHELCYGELASRAELLARGLVALDVRPGDRVALHVDPGAAWVVSVLAVLRAGAAYVPIDTAHPEHRKRFILSDARPTVILFEAGCAHELPDTGMRAMALDAEGRLLDGDCAPAHALPALHASQVAYVIYTSGTTGQPKGVEVTHHNVVRLLQTTRSLFDFSEHDVWSVFHSYAFDFSVWELWGALAHAARLVLVPRATARNPELFYHLLAEQRVTVLSQTPSAFSQLDEVDARKRAALSLRYIVFGGEALSFSKLADWLSRHGDDAPRLINMYGITEGTVHSTFRRVTRRDAASRASMIGAALPDLALYVVDRAGELLPDNAPGELWIGGDGVARGYLGQPTLTRERFLPDPFRGHPHRVLRTGDIVTRRPDGELEYVGRRDSQIKLRGHRIELGEIEACLARHPRVSDVVAQLRHDADAGLQIVAWIVAAQSAALEVRKHAQAELPDYMVPARLIALDKFPLTATGKVDKRALPMRGSAARAVTRIAARDANEALVTRVWEEVLGVDGIGVNESFFELGGHSLLAAKVVLRLRERTGVQLPVSRLFECPTVEALSLAIAREGAVGSGDIPVARMSADAQLEAWSLTAAVPEPHTDILLTGATGFLGVHVLDELLRHTRATIRCLVRCRDAADGLQRIEACLRRHRLDSSTARDRIEVVPGDLALPMFGLGQARFEALGRELGAVFHVGAWVNFLEGYERLRSANVHGTLEILRLCAQRATPLHYTSTTGVFGTPGYVRKVDTIYETDDISAGLGVGHLGYVQSKWVAERLVAQAFERGLPGAIYRCGLLMGAARTGVANTRDFPSLMIKGCLQLGAVYQIRKLDNFVPVDFAAGAMRQIALKHSTPARVFHVVNPQNITLDHFWQLLRACGCNVETIPFAAWVERFVTQPGGQEANALFPLVSLFLDKVADTRRSMIELFEDQPSFDMTHTLEALRGSNLQCPNVDEALVSTWLDYYVESGFLSDLPTGRLTRQPRTRHGAPAREALHTSNSCSPSREAL